MVLARVVFVLPLTGIMVCCLPLRPSPRKTPPAKDVAMRHSVRHSAPKHRLSASAGASLLFVWHGMAGERKPKETLTAELTGSPSLKPEESGAPGGPPLKLAVDDPASHHGAVNAVPAASPTASDPAPASAAAEEAAAPAAAATEHKGKPAAEEDDETRRKELEDGDSAAEQQLDEKVEAKANESRRYDMDFLMSLREVSTQHLLACSIGMRGRGRLREGRWCWRRVK